MYQVHIVQSCLVGYIEEEKNKVFTMRRCVVKKIIMLLIVTVSVLLTGCASGDQVNTAVEYLEALNTRDLETAQALVCDTRQDDVAMGLTTVDDASEEEFEFSNVSCAAQGDDVMCRFVIEQYPQGAEDTGVQSNRQVVFNFEDGRICGFEEQVAQ